MEDLVHIILLNLQWCFYFKCFQNCIYCNTCSA